jgi:single-stranded-DNA-specific exonuclease
MLLEARLPDRQALESLRRAGLPDLLARLYAARGVKDTRELDTELTGLLSPALLRNADRAAMLLADAIAARERLVIIADYDCDGATACAVGIRGLRLFGADVAYLVPNRFEYGYGLTPEIVDLAHTRLQPDWLITVDNGIASNEGVDRANALGMRVLVTDHHLPASADPATLPAAACIVNPNQPGCTFPSKNLAGVGVMFYVLLALRAELRRRGHYQGDTPQPRLDALLDLVALGTVADVVRLDANNRLLVAQGIKRMRALRTQPGITALFRVAMREARSASASDLGFAVGPRLNAAGRLSDMSLGIECLITDDAGRAEQIAGELDAINRERRGIEADMRDAALAALAVLDDNDLQSGNGRATLCLFDAGWHPGVIGIVAARLKDHLHRPAITFAPAGDHEPGVLRGSGRSIAGLHLRDALDLVSKRHPGMLLRFGGHAMAAGLTLREADFDSFSAAFEDAVRSLLDPALLTRTLAHDGPLQDAEASLGTIATLEAQVWGQGFAPPLFCDLFVVENQRLLKDKHLKLRLRKLIDGKPTGARYDAIWFNHADLLEGRARVVYRIAADHYNGAARIQLMVEHAEDVAA